MVIRALVFDLDGLLVDTESTDFAAWEWAYRERGVLLPRDRWQRAIGGDGSHFAPLAYLREQLNAPLDVEALQRERRRYRDALLEDLVPCPGVSERIAEARARGLRVAVASSSPRDWVERHLRSVALLECFDLLRCEEDVDRVKPDPALYREVVTGLGVRPDEAVAFEDSPNGVAAAVAAGLHCVAVPGPMTRGLDFDRAHLVLGSLAERALEEILADLTG